MKKILAIMIGFAMVMSAGMAFAYTTSGTANYDVTLTGACTIDTTAASTSFGSWSLGDADLSAANASAVSAGSVTVNCVAATNYILGVNGGGFFGAIGVLPAMTDFSGNFVEYALHDGLPVITFLGDADLNTVDAGYVSSNSVGNGWSRVGTGADEVINLFADVYINAATTAGTYSDTVTFTVAW